MWTVYFKEMVELLRDRKTFIFAFLVPLIAIPLIMSSLAWVSSKMVRKAVHAELTYSVFGADNAPALARQFASERGFRLVPLARVDDIKQAIDDEKIKFALVIPPNFEATLAERRQASLVLHYNNAVTLDITRRRVQAVIDQHNADLREGALAALNISQSQMRFVRTPIKLEEHSTANRREQFGALIGGFLPYFLLMVCLMAAMYPAIDLGAGEKERGTLETLLLAPIPRSSLVLAKFLVLFTFGLTSALLMVVSLGLLVALFGHTLQGEMATILRTVGLRDLLMVALMLVPTAAIFASILLSLSIYAKSYKEASGMVSPLMILLLVPIIIAMLPGVELNWLWAAVPITNVSLAMKELVKGTMDYRMFFVILLSSTAIAAGLLAWCSRWFRREDVLFRN
jgi:sodium transport system permease protein